jgi:predicted O-methyltransferase YrrM
MSQETWSAVDDYIDSKLVPADEALTAALIATEHAGLEAINVAPAQGKLLQILAQSVGARSILEIGTLGAYSTILLARALPDGGKLVTLEINPEAAEVARANLEQAGIAGRVEVIVGPALESLRALDATFDFVFIDANKDQNPEYFAESLARTRSGGLIVVDNVVRGGAVLERASEDPRVQGVRRLFDILAAEPRVIATAIQTVGVKGHDGFVIAYVR